MSIKSKSSKSVIVSSLSNVPSETAPKPPAGFTPPVRTGHGRRLYKAQVANAAAAAHEALSASFQADFGVHAPSGQAVGRALALAAAWSQKLEEAKAWTAYVAEQAKSAWSAAHALTDVLDPPFAFALSRDPTLASRYPHLTKVLRAPNEVAGRALAAREANAKKKRKQQKGATAAAPASPNKLLN
jgi:hypothetical protein